MSSELQPPLFPEELKRIDDEIAERKGIIDQELARKNREEFALIVSAVNPEDIDKYNEIRRTLERGVCAETNPPTGKITQINKLPYLTTQSYDPDSVIVRAAMAMQAVAYRAYPYRDETTSHQKPFSEIWQGTPLYQLSKEISNIVDNMYPQAVSQYTSVDLTRMRTAFENSIAAGTPEIIVITGLNGSGKTTAIEALTRFIKAAGVSVTTSKFPRPDSQMGKFIAENLAGKIIMDPAALQLAMLADGVDCQGLMVADRQILQVCDRHPAIETLVYGPDGTFNLVATVSRELFVPFRTIVICRHPINCIDSVRKRNTDQRIFEKQMPQMAKQLARYASLTTLPGCHWVDTDIPEEEPSISMATRRVVGTLISSGALDRALIKQGVCQNRQEAWSHLMNTFCRMNEWLFVKT